MSPAATLTRDPPSDTKRDAPEVIETHCPGLRFRRSSTPDFAGCLLIDNEDVDLATIIEEAEEFGTVEPIGDTTYFVVEFTFGPHKRSGSGKRDEATLIKMLEESRS